MTFASMQGSYDDDVRGASSIAIMRCAGDPFQTYEVHHLF